MPYVDQADLALREAADLDRRLHQQRHHHDGADQAWRESDLQAMIGIQGWSATSLVKAISTRPSGPPIAPEAGAFAFGAKLGFFGNNAPKWAILPNATQHQRHAYRDGWDTGDPDGTSGAVRST